MTTLLAQLQTAQAAYTEAVDADRRALIIHQETVDDYYEGKSGIAKADMEAAATLADHAYSVKQAAWQRVNELKARMLAEVTK